MSENFKPQTSMECYLAAISGDYEGELPKPQTRIQLLLNEIALKNSECDETVDLVGRSYFDEDGNKKGEIFGHYETNSANGANSVAFGTACHAAGDLAFAGGGGSTASGNMSFVFGGGSTASGGTSMAFGSGCSASGDYSLAFGGGCKAEDNYSFALGGGCTAKGPYSLSLGGGCTATGEGAVSLGSGSRSEGNYSFSMGKAGTSSASTHHTTASGDYSFAMGESVKATGKCSYAMGGWAYGYNGSCIPTEARGDYSFALGKGVVAASPNQFVIGKRNVIDEDGKFAFIIGNGSSTIPFTAFAIDWSGKIYAGNNFETGVNVVDLLNRVVTLESKVAELQNRSQGGETQ